MAHLFKKYCTILFFISLVITAKPDSYVKLTELEPIELEDGLNQYEVRDHCFILPDPSSTFEAKEVFKKDLNNFYPFKIFPTNKQDINSSYWLRFKITNNSSTKGAHLIEAFDPKIENIELYSLEGGQIQKVELGNKYQFDRKELKHKNNHFTINLDQGSTGEYLIRIQSYRQVGFRMVIRETKRFINYALKEYLIIGLFIGLILMIVIFNTTLFVNTKNRTYLFYIFYVASNLLFILSVNGIGYQYLWPFLPGFNRYATPIFLLFLSLSLYFYIGSFIQLDAIKDNVKKIFQYAIIIKIAVTIIGFLFYRPLFYDIRIDIIPFSAAFWLCYNAYKFEKSAYKHLLIGFYCLFAGFITYALLLSGYLSNIIQPPFRIIFVYGLDIAIILEVTFFSIAISKRMTNLNSKSKQKDRELIQVLTEKEMLTTKVNRELEQKVQERTEELNSKNSELTKLNQKLEKAAEIANKFNIDLDLQVKDLKKEIREEVKSNILLVKREISFEEFSNVFPSDYKCLENLEEIKWLNGYSCKKCGGEKYVTDEVKLKISRRCVTCGYDESATVNTLFHRVRFPIRKAFFLVYLVSSRENKITVDELEEKVQLRRATCWNFKKRVELAIEYLKKKKKAPIQWEDLVMVNPNKLK